MQPLEHIVMKTREAMQANGTGALSVGEAVAAALVLNRADWLAGMDYTIPQAIDRIGPEWAVLIPEAARIIAKADEAISRVEKRANDETALQSLGSGEDVVDVTAKLINYGHSPGYRSASFYVDVACLRSEKTVRLCLHFDAKDSAEMGQHIMDIHKSAWERRGGRPLDAKDGETRPSWMG